MQACIHTYINTHADFVETAETLLLEQRAKELDPWYRYKHAKVHIETHDDFVSICMRMCVHTYIFIYSLFRMEPHDDFVSMCTCVRTCVCWHICTYALLEQRVEEPDPWVPIQRRQSAHANR
jgi:hypothetical protein